MSCLNLSVALTVTLVQVFATGIVNARSSIQESERGNMTVLHLALHEGFSDDAVEIRVNDEMVFQKEAVTTRLQIGYADSFELDVEQGLVKVEVLIAARGVSDSLVIGVSKPMYVGIKVSPEDGVTYTIKYTPFKYA